MSHVSYVKGFKRRTFSALVVAIAIAGLLLGLSIGRVLWDRVPATSAAAPSPTLVTVPGPTVRVTETVTVAPTAKESDSSEDEARALAMRSHLENMLQEDSLWTSFFRGNEGEAVLWRSNPRETEWLFIPCGNVSMIVYGAWRSENSAGLVASGNSLNVTLAGEEVARAVYINRDGETIVLS